MERARAQASMRRERRRRKEAHLEALDPAALAGVVVDGRLLPRVPAEEEERERLYVCLAVVGGWNGGAYTRQDEDEGGRRSTPSQPHQPPQTTTDAKPHLVVRGHQVARVELVGVPEREALPLRLGQRQPPGVCMRVRCWVSAMGEKGVFRWLVGKERPPEPFPPRPSTSHITHPIVSPHEQPQTQQGGALTRGGASRARTSSCAASCTAPRRRGGAPQTRRGTGAPCPGRS